MLKYKSPLSRLLEGANRHADKPKVVATEADEPVNEPANEPAATAESLDTEPQPTQQAPVSTGFSGDLDEAFADLDRLRNSLSVGGMDDSKVEEDVVATDEEASEESLSIIKSLVAEQPATREPETSHDEPQVAETEYTDPGQSLTLAAEDLAQPFEPAPVMA